MLEALLVTHQPRGMEKLQSKIAAVKQFDQKSFFYLFAISTRWFDAHSVSDDAALFSYKEDFFGVLQTWRWSSLVRLYLLLLVAKLNGRDGYIRLYESLFNSADVQESIVLIESLAFIPHPEAFTEKVREAARSNITTLFSAVAHGNDYALNYFDELSWNQLVLKAAFLGESLIDIYGLQSRNNAALVSMLCDYAEERHAASRSVPWDLWACVGWRAKSHACFEQLRQVFLRADVRTKATITLALRENLHAGAVALTQQFSSDEEVNALSCPLTWEVIRNLKV